MALVYRETRTLEGADSYIFSFFPAAYSAHNISRERRWRHFGAPLVSAQQRTRPKKYEKPPAVVVNVSNMASSPLSLSLYKNMNPCIYRLTGNLCPFTCRRTDCSVLSVLFLSLCVEMGVCGTLGVLVFPLHYVIVGISRRSSTTPRWERYKSTGGWEVVSFSLSDIHRDSIIYVSSLYYGQSIVRLSSTKCDIGISRVRSMCVQLGPRSMYRVQEPIMFILSKKVLPFFSLSLPPFTT